MPRIPIITGEKLIKVLKKKSSISFVFTGLDADLYLAQNEDLKSLSKVESEISKARAKL